MANTWKTQKKKKRSPGHLSSSRFLERKRKKRGSCENAHTAIHTIIRSSFFFFLMVEALRLYSEKSTKKKGVINEQQIFLISFFIIVS